MSDAKPGNASQRLPGLEMLRFVAALCILLLHSRAVFGGQHVFGKGYLAVEFFLMLSGFLMAYGQEARIDRPWHFMLKRYKRLWPTMAIGGLLGLPRLFLRSSGVTDFATIAAMNLAIVPIWWRTFVFELNIPAWTIFAELLANALHVTVFRHLKLWSIGLLVLALTPIMIWIGIDYKSFDVGAKTVNFFAGFPRILFAYLIGIALGRIWKSGFTLPIPSLLAIPAMPIILLGSWWWKIDQSWIFDAIFVIIASPLMIVGGINLNRLHKTSSLLGQLSFPLFAVQMPLLQGAQMLGFSKWTTAVAAIIVSMITLFITRRIDTWLHTKPIRST